MQIQFIFKGLKVGNCFSIEYEFWTIRTFPTWNSSKLKEVLKGVDKDQF